MERLFLEIEKFFITTPLLNAISKGQFFTKAFAWILRVCAALLVIGFLYFSVTVWLRYASDFGGDGVGGFFVVLFAQLLAIVLCYVIINILLVRSNKINKLPLQTDYVVIPVAVQLIKMTGEIIATIMAIVGVYITLSLLVTGGNNGGMNIFDMGLFGRPDRWGGFASGYFAFIIFPVIGFLILVFFYSIAELIGALVDIARNTKKK